MSSCFKPFVDDLHKALSVFLDAEDCRQRGDVVNVRISSPVVLKPVMNLFNNTDKLTP